MREYGGVEAWRVDSEVGEGISSLGRGQQPPNPPARKSGGAL